MDGCSYFKGACASAMRPFAELLRTLVFHQERAVLTRYVSRHDMYITVCFYAVFGDKDAVPSS